jgi:selenophosphate synthetase-related protein
LTTDRLRFESRKGVNTENYTFDSIPSRITGSTGPIEAKQETAKNSILDTFRKQNLQKLISGPRPMESQFFTNHINSRFVVDPLRGFGINLQGKMTDVLDNHQFMGGIMYSLDFDSGGDIWFEYEYLKSRLDFRGRYDRKTLTVTEGDISFQKYTLTKVETGVAYPLSIHSRLYAAVLKLAAAPNLADKSWVTSQYDKYVQGNTIQSQPDDSGMIRIDETTNLGVAISTDANANWSYLNPYQGAKLALAEAARNIATAGARPLAVTNCLNFGSPEDPGVMWQFAESVRGLADGCLELGLPVTGGNVSFYNQTGAVAILPTPVIGVLGVIQDVRTRTPMSFTQAGLELYLLGETQEDLAGSEWAFLHNQRVGQSPDADLQREMRLIELLLEGNSFFAAAHDLSQGGLSAGLTEMVLRHKVGATVSLENAGVELLSETPGRVIVAIDPAHTSRLEGLAIKNSIVITKLGTTGGDALTINDAVISLAELSTAHTSTFPRLFG